jgi:uroporphyrinogen decarboxylase
LSEHIFIKACKREETERTPIWIMRQAGRYLPEYRAIREKNDFLTLCKTPELACEVTLQPIRRYGFDAAIIFSDILVIPEAMGMKLEIIESKGPVFDAPVRSESDIINLNVKNISERVQYVYDAINLTKKNLEGKTPLIGFSGAPWTLATYMIEGKGSKNFIEIKKLIYNEPELAHQLLDTLSEIIIEYLNEQMKAGADAVQIFDTWAGILSPDVLEEFSLKYITKIISGLNTNGKPVIVFAKGVNSFDKIAVTGCDAAGVDWTFSLNEARKISNDRISLQGNLDPCILFSNEEKVVAEAEKVLNDFGTGNGHIFNLGHGILPKTPVENVKALVDFVKEKSKKYHEAI